MDQPASGVCTASIHVPWGTAGWGFMQTDAGGYPATGQQPLYFLQQVTRYK